MGAIERLGIGDVIVEHSEAGSQLSASQTQTRDAFGYKWGKRDTYESTAFSDRTRDWLIERYCGGDPEVLSTWLAGGGKLILDAGCGSGMSGMLLFGEHINRNDYLGVDISSAVDVARQRFAEAGLTGQFLQSDLMNLPIPDASLDLILAEGVLHHTDDTGLAIEYLSRKLKPGGRFLFYVYARKAAIREAADDLVRERLQGLTDDEAWQALIPLTKLGVALGELGVALQIPEDIEILDISAGTSDIQRFFYWNIVKAFYSPDLTLEEMNHINFDWYRPLNCHRHTPEEVQRFCAVADLEIERFNVQEAGITVVGRRSQRV